MSDAELAETYLIEIANRAFTRPKMRRAIVNRDSRDGFTLIELLTVIFIIGLMIVLLLPAVQSAREGARRLQCSHQLRQIALASASYCDLFGTFPMGTPLFKFPEVGNREGHSIFVAMLGQLENQNLFNSINFSLQISTYGNVTCHRMAPGTLWCPSDPLIARSFTRADDAFGIPMGLNVISYSSYGGCSGTWYNHPMSYDDNAISRIPWITANNNGIFYVQSSVTLASVTDGLSNTFLLGERNQAILSDEEWPEWHWWFSSFFSATLFDTLYPINPQRRLNTHKATIGTPNAYTEAASSAHPSGANFAFADGSVRFIKDSINSWAFDQSTGVPLGLKGSFGTPYVLSPETRLGVYQALSTRNGGEITQSEF